MSNFFKIFHYKQLYKVIENNYRREVEGNFSLKVSRGVRTTVCSDGLAYVTFHDFTYELIVT